MSMTPRPPIPSFIPETAPFTPEQRTWLNGLFAGLFGLEESVTPLSPADAAKCWLVCLMAPRRPRPRPTITARMMEPLGTIRRCRSPSA